MLGKHWPMEMFLFLDHPNPQIGKSVEWLLVTPGRTKEKTAGASPLPLATFALLFSSQAWNFPNSMGAQKGYLLVYNSSKLTHIQTVQTKTLSLKDFSLALYILFAKEHSLSRWRGKGQKGKYHSIILPKLIRARNPKFQILSALCDLLLQIIWGFILAGKKKKDMSAISLIFSWRLWNYHVWRLIHISSYFIWIIVSDFINDFSELKRQTYVFVCIFIFINNLT